MEPNQKPAHQGLNIATITASIIGFIAAVLVVFGMIDNGGGALSDFSFAFYMLAFMYAVLYILRGGKKNAAEDYKLALIVFAIAIFVNILASVNSVEETGKAVSTLYIAQLTISFAVLCMLAFNKDFGKKNSVLCCLVAGILALISVIYAFMNPLGVKFYLRCIGVPALFMSLAAFFMILIKYKDKEARGSK